MRPQSSGQFEITRPVHAEGLVVSARTQPQVDLGSPRTQLEGKEVTPVDIRAVRREGVDLSLHVHASDQPVSVAPCSVATQHHDISMAGRPLALHPN